MAKREEYDFNFKGTINTASLLIKNNHVFVN